ncbi:DNA repair ATPase [Ilumatobacter nonamiensis]|uniref:DNA repair ATPase n=1 Tax=Ilumatobacter nonamiensis TaxID=467093 RepID=UPI00034B3F7A|nr:DNA repair ATPase [Ilumatobacter nonamiensis]
MTDTPTTDAQQAQEDETLRGGSYDLLRRRVATQTGALEDIAHAIDADRVEAFGSVGLALTGADRLATDLACLPRDIARIGNLLLLGFNLDVELSVQQPEQVFALYEVADIESDQPQLSPIADDDPRNFLADPEFRTEFDKLVRFFGKTRFSDLRTTQNQLLAVFQVGDRIDDVRVFRWTLTGERTTRTATFVDARGDRDYTWPPPHDQRWTTASREDQRAGAHPVVSIQDEVFVGFRGGRLQLRVETGEGGSHAEIDETIANSGQSLADLRVDHLTVGDILLIRVHLYEEDPRTYVFSRRSRTGRRVDAAGVASRLLPGGEGLIFPGGYHLTSTGTRVFDVDVTGLRFEELIAAPNGEDVLYVFHRLDLGEYLLMPYNLVRREVSQVITCHGFATFNDGSMVLFRDQAQDIDAAKIHPIQWWQTPFADPDHVPDAGDTNPWMQRVGNAALVSGLGDVYDIVRLSRDDEPTARSWEGLASSTRRAMDQHLWFVDEEAHGLHAAAHEVLTTAGQLLDEHKLVERKRSAARATLATAEADVRQVLNGISTASTPDQVVGALGQLRRARGELSVVADTDAIDTERVETLIGELDAGVTELSERAVDVLSRPAAFATLESKIATAEAAVGDATTSAQLDEIAERLDVLGNDLDAVVDTVSALEGGDPTVRTTIVRSVSEVTGAANRVSAQLDSKRRNLGATETAAAFDAELALVEQTLNGSVSAAATAEECDAVLARLLVTIERLESRYGDDPDHSASIAEVRSTAHEVVGERRTALLDERNRRATRIVDAATRLLETVTRRASEFADDKEVASFFATDQLTSRVRELADELESLDDAGRAAEVRSGLRNAMEEARRRIRDKAALVSDDGAVVLGGVRLAPNTQPFEMVLSARSDEQGNDTVAATITATDFAVDATAELQDYADLLGRSFPSETSDVSRSEYLAWAVLEKMVERPGGLQELLTATANPAAMNTICQAEAERRHGDGYQRGVHDQDAARILTAVMPSLEAEPLLRFTGLVRGLARLWLSQLDDDAVAAWVAKSKAADTAAQRLGATGPAERLAEEARYEIEQFVAASAAPPAHRSTFGPVQIDRAASYLVDELAVGPDVVASSTATALVGELRGDLGDDGVAELEVALAAEPDAVERFVLAHDWVTAYVAADESRADKVFDIAEAAAMLATPELAVRRANQGGAITVTGLVADHRRIVDGELVTRTDELAEGAGALFAEMQTRWPEYSDARRRVVERQRQEVKLDEHRPRVMSGFVRNTLIDTALLPLFGPNLGRQLGTVDPTDVARQGLLVVVSPPGYGKTTLMEWIADRLGLLIVKANGPALGHDTTSLDPGDAPNAAARAEVEKINLAFRMGRNVMLYLDDIQHTSPTLLSRFIPLADATRRVEGVVDGEPTTFDLRGKRFCVVMAGNPYTTGGGRFEMPDMLVNRSDVFNLGDVSGEHAEAFARSYIENSLTACPTVAPHASKLLDDLGPVLEMASGRKPVETSGLDHAWDGAELDATVRAVAMLRRAQDVLLKVNAAYIASAATADEDRTAPPFLLQGSYRNMGRIAGRVVPVMSEAELDDVVDDHYNSEAQTLTDKAEQNLLAYRALSGHMSEADRERWAEILDRTAARAAAADGVGRVVGALDRLTGAVLHDPDDPGPLGPR